MQHGVPPCRAAGAALRPASDAPPAPKWPQNRSQSTGPDQWAFGIAKAPVVAAQRILKCAQGQRAVRSADLPTSGMDIRKAIEESGGVDNYARRLEGEAARGAGDPRMYCAAAMMRVAAGRPGRAVQLTRKALRIDPDMAVAHTIMGRAYLCAGKPARAIRWCRRATRLDPSLCDAHEVQGYAMILTGRPTEALRRFRAAVRLDPDSAEAHEGMGHMLFMTGRYKRAAACYKRVAELEPGSVYAAMSAANCLATAGLHEEAVAELDKAIALAPRMSFAHYMRGESLSKTGRHGEAAAAYGAATDADPGNTFLWAAKAISCSRAGMVARGRDSLEKAKSLRKAGSQPRIDDLEPMFDGAIGGISKDMIDILRAVVDDDEEVDRAIADADRAVAAAEGGRER